MNQTAKDRIKNLIPIIQAFSEGKVIQEFNNSKWNDVNELDFLNFFNLEKSPSIYRIKPEPNYIPFINKEECWAEMHKHPDFGWVKDKDGKNINMLSVGKDKSFNLLFNLYTFTDGKPFGVKES